MNKWFDEVICLDFDFTCSTRLLFYDAEKEKAQLEAMTDHALTDQLTKGGPAVFDRSNAVQW